MAMDPTPSVPLTPPDRGPSRGRGSRVLDVALALAAVLAIGGVAFTAGRLTAPAGAGPAFARGLAPGGMAMAPGGSFDPSVGDRGVVVDGGLALDGTVTAVDADSLTIKLASGQEMTFELDDTTTFHEAAAASPSDVAVGDDVTVRAAGGDRVVPGDSAGAPVMSAGDVTVSR